MYTYGTYVYYSNTIYTPTIYTTYTYYKDCTLLLVTCFFFAASLRTNLYTAAGKEHFHNNVAMKNMRARSAAQIIFLHSSVAMTKSVHCC